MRAREALCRSEVLGGDLAKVLPVTRDGLSDSATFDNVLEFLVMNGRSLPHAILMMIPEPWQNHESMSPERRAFYEFHASLMEPWDGPASIAFTDGTVIGAVLDRNGLRPSRYYVTKDGLVVMASEVGVLDIPRREHRASRSGCTPGKIFLVDTAQGRIIDDEEIKAALAAEHPYADWLRDNVGAARPDLPDAAGAGGRPRHGADPPDRLRLHARGPPPAARAPWRRTARSRSAPWAPTPRWPCCRTGPRPLYDYFKQLFAQVTNPPLDQIREELVTSMESTVGPEGNLLRAGAGVVPADRHPRPGADQRGGRQAAPRRAPVVPAR